MTTLQHAPLEVALTTTRPVLPSSDELAGRLAEHLVAGALVRKSVNDPVPFQVWWRVSDALRASVHAAPADAVPEVDAAIAALVAQVRGLAVGPRGQPPAARRRRGPRAPARPGPARPAGLRHRPDVADAAARPAGSPPSRPGGCRCA